MTKAPKPEPDAGRLLSLVADALTACERDGLKVRLRHGGIIETRRGYVLRSGDGWVARTLDYTEFSPAPSGSDEED